MLVMITIITIAEPYDEIRLVASQSALLWPFLAKRVWPFEARSRQCALKVEQVSGTATGGLISGRTALNL